MNVVNPQRFGERIDDHRSGATERHAATFGARLGSARTLPRHSVGGWTRSARGHGRAPSAEYGTADRSAGAIRQLVAQSRLENDATPYETDRCTDESLRTPPAGEGGCKISEHDDVVFTAAGWRESAISTGRDVIPVTTGEIGCTRPRAELDPVEEVARGDPPAELIALKKMGVNVCPTGTGGRGRCTAPTLPSRSTRRG
jgi:hypothetical protein